LKRTGLDSYQLVRGSEPREKEQPRRQAPNHYAVNTRKAKAMNATVHTLHPEDQILRDEEGHDAHAALSHDNAKRFILAGNATVTFASPTGVRFTFKVRAKDVNDGAKTLHFVSVLTGSDNESDFTFLGTIFDSQTFRHGRKSRIGQDAPSARAFAWAFPRIMGDAADLQGMEIFHEGRCGACGRKLTIPESITAGLGPVCAGR